MKDLIEKMGKQMSGSVEEASGDDKAILKSVLSSAAMLRDVARPLRSAAKSGSKIAKEVRSALEHIDVATMDLTALAKKLRGK